MSESDLKVLESFTEDQANHLASQVELHGCKPIFMSRSLFEAIKSKFPSAFEPMDCSFGPDEYDPAGGHGLHSHE